MSWSIGTCINVKSRDPVHFKVSLESLHEATNYIRETDRVIAFKRYRMCTEILMVHDDIVYSILA